MGPFERWDDWEWERAAHEVGREHGMKPRWEPANPPPTRRGGWERFFRHWSGAQKRTLLAALLLITVALSARNNDPFSEKIYAAYKGVMATDYYTTLNSMVKEVAGMSGGPAVSTLVDAKMQGKFLPPVSGPVVAGFGLTNSDKSQTHQGIDVGSALGVPVVSPYSGVVTQVSEEQQLGRVVKLDFGDGWSAVLGNLGEITVKKGQKVNKGEIIGTVGLSAELKKPWLHFELRKNNRPLNPLPYLVPSAK